MSTIGARNAAERAKLHADPGGRVADAVELVGLAARLAATFDPRCLYALGRAGRVGCRLECPMWALLVKPPAANAETQSVNLDRLRVRPEPHRPVEVQVMGPGFLDVLRARDVSQTGLGILVPHRFEGCDLLGDVELIITLPGSPSFSAAGILRHRTRHCDVSFFGVELTRISDRDRLALRAYVSARHAEESGQKQSRRTG